jgi:LPS sulfotransferase NodH
MITEQEPAPFRRIRQSTIYIIASTNRTGSHLLCEGLNATDVAGHPQEALTPEYRHELCQFLYGTNLDFSASIKTMIRQGMTPNGVFGVKVHWDQVEEIAFELGYDGEPHIFLLEELPGAEYIHLFRRDTLAQAISLYIALQTEEWWRLTGVENPYKKRIEPIFNAAEILRLEQNLIRQRNAWEAFFILEGIAPLRMEYEALAADYRGEVGRVLDFLGQDRAIAQTIPEPRLQKQGDALNAIWMQEALQSA